MSVPLKEKVIHGLIHGNQARPIHVDTVTRSLVCIEHYHSEINDGNHFYLEGWAELGSGVSLYVKLVTPDTLKWAHFIWEIQSNFILETDLYEGPSGGMAGGTPIIPLNNNRNSANTSGLVITKGVSEPDNTGLTVSNTKWGSKSTGSSQSRIDELILKQNTVYCRKFLSGTNSNLVLFKASWYEHINKS